MALTSADSQTQTFAWGRDNDILTVYRFRFATEGLAVSSAQTLNPSSRLGPKVLLMGTSAASRPRAIRIRPIRGVLLRGSKVYYCPSR